MSRIEKLNELLACTPTDCFILHALGLEYVKLKDIETAILYFKRVLDIDKNYVGTYYHLAKALEITGDTKLAIDIYTEGIKAANFKKDNHAKNELQMALDELLDI